MVGILSTKMTFTDHDLATHSGSPMLVNFSSAFKLSDGCLVLWKASHGKTPDDGTKWRNMDGESGYPAKCFHLACVGSTMAKNIMTGKVGNITEFWGWDRLDADQGKAVAARPRSEAAAPCRWR